MLRSIDDLLGFEVQARNGEKGEVTDVYFDDDSWTVRYFVVEIGSWLSGERVLIAPDVVGVPDYDEEVLPINLTGEQIENAPELDFEQPVSRQKLMDLHEYYGWAPWWPGYWAGNPTMSVGGVYPAVPPSTALPHTEEVPEPTQAERRNPHLRSADEVIGYHIQATDDDIGHIEDFFVDTADWIIRYVLVDTRNLLPGKKVLLAPSWIEDIEWDEANVYVELTQEQVKNSPEYDPDKPLTRDYETELYGHYGRRGYWEP